MPCSTEIYLVLCVSFRPATKSWERDETGKLEALKEEAEEHDSKLKDLKRAKDKATKVNFFSSFYLVFCFFYSIFPDCFFIS